MSGNGREIGKLMLLSALWIENLNPAIIDGQSFSSRNLPAVDYCLDKKDSTKPN
jgi:hypothetical protein